MVENNCIEQAGQKYTKWFYENNVVDKDNLPLTRGEFIKKLLTDDEFYQRWGEDCCEELTYIERYNIWIGNNYETGVEYIPEIVPDFDNDYYEPTPKRKLREMKNELIGRTLDLDLGSTPVNMTIKEITETKVIVEYNHSTPGRTEEFSVSDFEYLSGLKIK
jgi:hypothetical protein